MSLYSLILCVLLINTALCQHPALYFQQTGHILFQVNKLPWSGSLVFSGGQGGIDDSFILNPLQIILNGSRSIFCDFKLGDLTDKQLVFEWQLTTHLLSCSLSGYNVTSQKQMSSMPIKPPLEYKDKTHVYFGDFGVPLCIDALYGLKYHCLNGVKPTFAHNIDAIDVQCDCPSTNFDNNIDPVDNLASTNEDNSNHIPLEILDTSNIDNTVPSGEMTESKQNVGPLKLKEETNNLQRLSSEVGGNETGAVVNHDSPGNTEDTGSGTLKPPPDETTPGSHDGTPTDAPQPSVEPSATTQHLTDVSPSTTTEKPAPPTTSESEAPPLSSSTTAKPILTSTAKAPAPTTAETNTSSTTTTTSSSTTTSSTTSSKPITSTSTLAPTSTSTTVSTTQTSTSLSTTPDPCANNLCKNGATCTISEGNATCKCTSQYTGDTCDDELKSTPIPSRQLGALEIAGIVICLALVAVLSVATYYLVRYVRTSRRLKGKYNPAREENVANSGPEVQMSDLGAKEERLI